MRIDCIGDELGHISLRSISCNKDGRDKVAVVFEKPVNEYSEEYELLKSMPEMFNRTDSEYMEGYDKGDVNYCRLKAQKDVMHREEGSVRGTLYACYFLNDCGVVQG